MVSMGVIPSHLLGKTLHSHVETFINECDAYNISGDPMHMQSAERQLTQFVQNNFREKREHGQE